MSAWPCRGRVDAVGQPEAHLAAGGGGGEGAVQRDEDGVEFAGQLARDGDLRVEVDAPRFAVGWGGQQERLHHDEARVQLVAHVGEDGAVVAFVGFGGCGIVAVVAPPRVVDADHNRNPRRLEIEAVALPAGAQILDAVAADAAIEEAHALLRVFRGEPCGCHRGVAVAQLVVVYAAAARVGDAVALKKNDCVIFNNGCHW